jgi:hypothetical protein
MRLRTFSRFLIASVLASGCAGGSAGKKDDTIDHVPPPAAPADPGAFHFDGTAWHERLADGTDFVHPTFPVALVVSPDTFPGGVDAPTIVAQVRATPDAASPADRAVAAAFDAAGEYPQALVRELADGSFLVTLANGMETATLLVVEGGATLVDQRQRPMPEYDHPRGRRPEGLVSQPAPAGDARARFLASAHHLEAASVPAFERLAAELAGLGAPPRLVRAARAAARDERRHAAAMRRLGAVPSEVVVAETGARDARTIALENAVEGCVHEAFAAILCDYQAARAADPEVAATMALIAEDEHRHAALSEAVAAWLAPRLTPADRAAIDRAVADALAALPDRIAAEADRHAGAADALGLPPRDHATALALSFARWRGATGTT